MSSNTDTIDEVVQVVNERGEEVSVSEISDEVGISHGYALKLAKQAKEERRIDGDKSTPVLGYTFRNTDDIEVATTRNQLLSLVRERAPGRLSDAQGKSLDDLRKFVRREIADDTIPVNMAWRFFPN